MSLIKYKILLIDNKIKGIDIISKSISDNVKVIILNDNIDSYISLVSKINKLGLKNIENIGLIKDEEYGDVYNLFKLIHRKPLLKEIKNKDPNI